MHIKELPLDERPIEKAIKYGLDKLSNVELLALIIHTGTKERSAKELAEEILSKDKDGIRHLANCEVEELEELEGIGPAKAARILASVELGKRVANWTGPERYIRSSEDAADLLMEDMRYLMKEFFKVILLNSKGKLITVDTVSVGELNAASVHPREVFSKAIKRGAAAIVLAHNHPSGDPTPSSEDINTTKRLIEVGSLMGIPVLDHVIIGDGKFSSLRRQRLF
ncbi:MAG: DNA repair protein RadC [Clostridia bacterium]|nr:DNA repair protein RadC [Clostridia bacterium]